MNTSLALRSTVRELCTVFAQEEANVRAAFVQLGAAEDRINAAFMLGDERRLDFRIYASNCHHPFDASTVEDAIKRMRRDGWRVIVDRLEIRRALSIERERQLTKSLDEDEPLPLTEENVIALVRRFAEDLPTLWQEAVHEVFEWLRPRDDSWSMRKYKTNQKNARLEIGQRVVITGALETYLINHWRVRQWDQQRFLALDNVFSGLDGKGTISKSHYGPLVDAIESTPMGTTQAATEYFEAMLYKNRSVHLRFRRLDLLAKFNAMAGGARLKPGDDERRSA